MSQPRYGRDAAAALSHIGARRIGAYGVSGRRLEQPRTHVRRSAVQPKRMDAQHEVLERHTLHLPCAKRRLDAFATRHSLGAIGTDLRQLRLVQHAVVRVPREEVHAHADRHAARTAAPLPRVGAAHLQRLIRTHADWKL